MSEQIGQSAVHAPVMMLHYYEDGNLGMRSVTNVANRPECDRRFRLYWREPNLDLGIVRFCFRLYVANVTIRMVGNPNEFVA